MKTCISVLTKLAAQLLLAAAILMLPSRALFAQAAQQTAEPLTIPIKVVNGKLIAIGYITDASDRKVKSHVSYEISLSSPHTLLFDEYMFLWIDHSQMQAGESVFIDVSFKPDAVIKIPAREIVPAEYAQGLARKAFTVINEPELQGHPLMGVLGQGFLKKYRAVLDLPEGKLLLYPLTANVDATGAVIKSFSIKNGLMRVPLEYADGKKGELSLGDDYDTFIDRQTAIALGKPAGDVSPVSLKGDEGDARIDLSQYVAFRPNKTMGVAGAVRNNSMFISGVNLLESLRVDIDWANSRIGFSQGKPAEYPKADFEFFKAQAAADMDLLQKYLEQYSKARLAPAAAAELMQLRLAAKNSTDEQLMQALRWVADTSRIPNRTIELLKPCVERMREMPDRLDLSIRAANFALEYSRGAMVIQEAYRLHYFLGEDYLQRGEIKAAWKHLLSAAFMPLEHKLADDAGHNVAVNARLGKIYEERGRVVRAYSRYKKAADLLAPFLTLLDTSTDAELVKMPIPAMVKNIRLMQLVRQDVEAGLERLGPQLSAEAKEMLDET